MAVCQPAAQSQLQQMKIKLVSIAGAVAPGATVAGRSPVARGNARDSCILSRISSPAYKSANILFNIHLRLYNQANNLFAFLRWTASSYDSLGARGPQLKYSFSGFIMKPITCFHSHAGQSPATSPSETEGSSDTVAV